MSGPLLKMLNICKDFPGVKALSGVDFHVNPGEIHALLGENGAGKSTLVKILTGVYPKDSGSVIFNGKEIETKSTKDAEECGISTVYQEINLIPEMSVAENICLGRQPVSFGKIKWNALKTRAVNSLKRLDMNIDVSQNLSSYSIAIQQMVAIARAIDIKADLLILDEPTSSLDENEVEELFNVMKKLKGQGMSIIFITHFLDEVYKITDRLTILRDGKLVGQYDTASLDRVKLIELMIGKSSDQIFQTTKKTTARNKDDSPFLSAKDIGRKNSVSSVDLDVYKSEVIGFAGLLGSGRTETARLLFGLDKITSGEIKINSEPAALRSPRNAIRKKIAFTPEDRKISGCIPNLSIRENIILALQANTGYIGMLPLKKQKDIAEKFIKILRIKTPDMEKKICELSGGNQQKVILARWLALNPQLLILDEPTRGIDIGAKSEIEALISELCGKGMSIILISSEMEEITRNSHKVIVMRDRKKVGELSGDDIEIGKIIKIIAEHA